MSETLLLFESGEVIVTCHKFGTRWKYSGNFFLVCSQTYAKPCKHLHNDFFATTLANLHFFSTQGCRDPSVNDSSKLKSIGLMDLFDGMGIKVIDASKIADLKKESFEPGSNRWPRDDYVTYYSPTLFHLSYRRLTI
jgi:hypothetical protein